MDGRAAKANREIAKSNAEREAQTAFQPLDPSALAEPVDYHTEALGQRIRTCPRCGAEDAVSARFCRHCGMSFAGAPPEEGRRRLSSVWTAVAAVLAFALIAGGVIAYRASTRSAPAPILLPQTVPATAPPPAVSGAAPSVSAPSAPTIPTPTPPAAAAAAPPVLDLRPRSDAPAPRPAARAILDPVWVLRPSQQDVSDLYPLLAAEENRTGMAVIDCVVTASGRLSACRVAAERPARYGFGAATLKLASRFRMRTTTRSGEPIAGRRVRVPVRWRMDD